MGKRGTRHTFETYPEELQQAIDEKLKKGIPYKDIVNWINNMEEVKEGEIKGTSIAGVHRYAKNFKERLEHSKKIREQVKAVLQETKDNPDTDMVEAANKIAIEMVVERLMNANMGELESESVLDVIGAVTKLQRSAVGNEKLKIQFMKYKADIENKRKKALEEFTTRLYDELESKYPELYQKLIIIASETFEKIELEM
ncbi:phage protein Gp27 family protein [Vallitalea guaymasensis]|uniref:phage protein Gp27 family protein n=1 Tax=Vallitalea guaymasensis TaxID=1185412 RepID=UPI000DE3CE74|nr:phage protein Gp27 family protein [Vallitalea guaymasensis]